MTFVPATSSLGLQRIADTALAVSTMFAGGRKPGPQLGDIIRAIDPTYGAGEFIYLQGVASTVVGSLVTFDPYLNTTTLAPATGGKGPVAVAMSINLLGYYGWYQIGGVAAVKCPNSVVVGADVYMLAATPGSVDDAQVNGEQVLNATFSTDTGTPSSGLALVHINRPFLQGQVV